MTTIIRELIMHDCKLEKDWGTEDTAVANEG